MHPAVAGIFVLGLGLAGDVVRADPGTANGVSAAAPPPRADAKVGVRAPLLPKKLKRAQKRSLKGLSTLIWDTWRSARPDDLRIRKKPRAVKGEKARLRGAVSAGKRAKVDLVLDSEVTVASETGTSVQFVLIDIQTQRVVQTTELSTTSPPTAADLAAPFERLRAALSPPPVETTAPSSDDTTAAAESAQTGETRPEAASDAAASPTAPAAPTPELEQAGAEASATPATAPVSADEPSGGVPSNAPADSRSWLWSTAGLFGGTALASIAAGSLLGISAANLRAFEQSTPLTQARLDDLNHQVLTLSIGADAFFVVAALSTVTSACLFAEGLWGGSEE